MGEASKDWNKVCIVTCIHSQLTGQYYNWPGKCQQSWGPMIASGWIDTATV